MKCAICNNESLNLNAKYCSKCGNKLIYQNRFCNKCGKKIDHQMNFCSECGNKINLYYIDNDSKISKFTKDKTVGEETKKQNKEININNGEDFVDMENNIVKESYLEVLPSQEIINNEIDNTLPSVNIDRNLLLPVIVNKKEVALIEIKKEINNLREINGVTQILKAVKILAKVLAKLVRFCFISTASIISFVGVSILIVMSTAIITKNVVNSYYGSTPQKDTTYSIFQMKSDYNGELHKN